MIVSTLARLPYGKSSKPPLELLFRPSSAKLSQRRFTGRISYVPAIDLSKYRFSAVVDWIEFRAAFVRVTQHRYVQARLSVLHGRNSEITPVNPGDGGESNTFDIKIQDPKSLAHVLKMYEALALHFGERTDPLVCGVEFSLDGYPRVPSDGDRHLLVGLMHKTFFTSRDVWSNPRSRPRSSIGKKTPGPVDFNNRKLLQEGKDGVPGEPYLWPESHRPAYLDGTMYVGDDDNDDVMMRIMDKEIDRQHPKTGPKRLVPDEKRVRIEVRIQGHELDNIGCFDLRDLENFNFGRLQGRYFQFMLPTFSTDPERKTAKMNTVALEVEKRRAEIFLKSGVIGLQARDRVREIELQEVIRQFGRSNTRRAGVGATGTLIAYAGLNRVAALAFTKLGEKETRAWRRLTRS